MTSATATSLSELTGTYKLDLSHTRIGFSARHAVVTKVRGQFTEFDGTGHLDGADPSKSTVSLTIQAASINTHNEKRDAHLRSNDFLDIPNHPEITFVSTAARRIDATTFELTGDLTIRGVTKPITVPFEFDGSVKDPYGQQRLGFAGSVVINRLDWGVNWNAMLEAGGVLVSEKVTLDFEISAIKQA